MYGTFQYGTTQYGGEQSSSSVNFPGIGTIRPVITYFKDHIKPGLEILNKRIRTFYAEDISGPKIL